MATKFRRDDAANLQLLSYMIQAMEWRSTAEKNQ